MPNIWGILKSKKHSLSSCDILHCIQEQKLNRNEVLKDRGTLSHRSRSCKENVTVPTYPENVGTDFAHVK